MEGPQGGDLELLSKTLQVEHKLFYFDLKENPRGRYLKISEKTSGSRSTIIVPASGISIFVDLFKYYTAGDNSELANKDLPLESTEVQLDAKVFYFDVGENQRGRFLKVSEVTRNRSTIIVPAGNEAAEGWAAFRDILSDIDEAQHVLQADNHAAGLQDSALPSEHLAVQSLGVVLSRDDSQAGSSESPIAEPSMILPSSGSDAGGTFSKVLRAEQKKFFFDLGSNARGQFLKISEVTGADRSAIILPVSALEQFYETLGQFVETVKSQGMPGPGLARVRPVAPPRKWNEG